MKIQFCRIVSGVSESPTLCARIPTSIIEDHPRYFNQFVFGYIRDGDWMFVEISFEEARKRDSILVYHFVWNDMIILHSDWIGEIPREWEEYKNHEGFFKFIPVGNTVYLATNDCEPTDIVVQYPI